MYICRECGITRDELPTVREYHNDYYFEDYADTRCTACGEFDAMEKAVECDRCGDLVPLEAAEAYGFKYVCGRCAANAEREREARKMNIRRRLNYGDIVRIDERVCELT